MNESPSTDDELMGAAGAGDRAAFSRLVQRLLPRAQAIAARLAPGRGEAEDIVQEAFLRLWRKAPTWRPRGDGETVRPRADDEAPGATDGATASVGTWLHRVVVNLCLDAARRRPIAPLEAAGELVDPAPAADVALHRDQIARRVAVAVAALPDRQRAALALCHFEGLGNKDAAAILGITVGALESLLVRARQALRASLADLAGEHRS